MDFQFCLQKSREKTDELESPKDEVPDLLTTPLSKHGVSNQKPSLSMSQPSHTFTTPPCGSVSFQPAVIIVSKRASLRLLKPRRIQVTERTENKSNRDNSMTNDTIDSANKENKMADDLPY